MTAEEIQEFIDNVGEDKVIAALLFRDYYVNKISPTPTAPANLLVTGKIKLMDASGFPLVGHSVRVETLRVPISVDPGDGSSPYYVGESTTRRIYELNASGIIEIPLVIGSKVLIHIEGGFTREITVPAENFDVLSVAASVDNFLSPVSPVTLEIRGS